MNTFYDKVRDDDLLGFIFNDVAKTDWAAHLPKMYAFWETMIFRSAGYVGNRSRRTRDGCSPRRWAARNSIHGWRSSPPQSVDGLFAWKKAEHIKSCVVDMANVIHAKINDVVQRRYDCSKLTPEQRARYASYKPKAVVT